MHDPFQKSRILYTGRRPDLLRKKKRFSKKFVIVILAVIFFAGLVFGTIYVLRLDKFQVREAGITGLQSLSEKEVRKTILEKISGNALLFIPRSNFFLVSSEGLERALLKKFPKIAEVNVNKRPPAELGAVIVERTIWGIGCVKTEVEEILDDGSKAAGEPAKTVGPCFYVDKDGFAFEDVSSFEGGLFPILYRDGAGVLGSHIFSGADVSFFEDAGRTLEAALQLPLLSLELSSENEEDARLTLKEGWYLIVLRNKAPGEWAAVLRTLIQNEIKGERRQLEYVDLRFGNKVFYKYR